MEVDILKLQTSLSALVASGFEESGAEQGVNCCIANENLVSEVEFSVNDLGALNSSCGSMEADVMDLQTSLSALVGAVVGQVLQALPGLLGTTISDLLRPALQDSVRCVVPPIIEKMIQKKLFEAGIEPASGGQEDHHVSVTPVPKSTNEFINCSPWFRMM